MFRIVFATATLIALHTLSRDLATAEASADVKAFPVPTQSSAKSAPKNRFQHAEDARPTDAERLGDLGGAKVPRFSSRLP